MILSLETGVVFLPTKALMSVTLSDKLNSMHVRYMSQNPQRDPITSTNSKDRDQTVSWNYSRTSVTRTRMVRLPWLFRTSS